MRNLALGIVTFFVVFVAVGFALLWGPDLARPVVAQIERPNPCQGECVFDASGEKDGGPAWERLRLWGPSGAPDLDVYFGKDESRDEPITEFSEVSRFRTAGRSVGRLQLLLDAGGRAVKTTCTAFLITETTVLTASHCSSVDGKEGKILRAALRLGFLDSTTKGEGQLFAVKPDSVVSAQPAAPVDAMTLELTPEAATAIGALRIRPLVLASTAPPPGADLYVVAHPLGLEQIVLRSRCRVATRRTADAEKPAAPDDAKPADPKAFLHTCGTAPGVSGAPIFDDKTNAVVAIHVQQQVKVDQEARSIGFGVPIGAIAETIPGVKALLSRPSENGTEAP